MYYMHIHIYFSPLLTLPPKLHCNTSSCRNLPPALPSPPCSSETLNSFRELPPSFVIFSKAVYMDAPAEPYYSA